MPLGSELIGRAVAHRCRRGLYAAKQVQFGNRVSEDGGNRTRRKWLPNAHRKKLFSEQLKTSVSFQVTAAALRSIDKAGGLDNYVRKIKGTREDSQGASEMRIRLGDEKSLEQLKEEGKAQHQMQANAENRKRTLWQNKQDAAQQRLRETLPAGQRPDSQNTDGSPMGWLKDKMGGGFKWQ